MMSRKKSSGWTMAKALYVLPIAAFAAIAFANCSKTEDESKKNLTNEVTEDYKVLGNFSEDIFLVVEEMPEFPGGELELHKFIAENVRYPEDAKEQKKAGKVFVGFVIDKEGFVRDVELRRGIDCESINNEALRVVKMLPQWKPGKQSGQNVPVSFVVPINFQL